jgi:hypothetical protein
MELLSIRLAMISVQWNRLTRLITGMEMLVLTIDCPHNSQLSILFKVMAWKAVYKVQDLR